jgi:hypothetical protein
VEQGLNGNLSLSESLSFLENTQKNKQNYLHNYKLHDQETERWKNLMENNVQFGIPYPKCLGPEGFQIFEYLYCTPL